MKSSLTIFVVSVALGIQSATYDATTDWASVSSAGYADGTADLTGGNGWQNVSAAATVKDAVILVDGEGTGGELVYGPAAPLSVNDVQSMYLHFPAVVAGDEPEDPSVDTLADIAVVGNGAVTNWYGWCVGGWTKLTGAVPGGACDVRIELDNRTANRLVRYSVKTTGDFVPLTTGEHSDGWLPAAASDKTSISEVAFAGKTALTGVELTQTGTVTVNDTRMSEQGITAAQLGDTGANGNPNWENLVLGLKCKDESSIPVVRPVQTSDPNTVTLKLDGVDVDAGSGSIVTYTVTASDAIGGAGTTTAPIAYDQNAAMALPDDGVKYYRMKVTAMPAK